MTAEAEFADVRLFTSPRAWADMESWHQHASLLRRDQPVLRCERDGFTPFWALTRHADVFTVSRDNARWLNTNRSVLHRDTDWEGMVASGMPLPASLPQLDGTEHRQHRQVTNNWFKPAKVGQRQPRIDALTDLFIDKMRDLGGECDFATDIAQPYTLRVIMDIYGIPEDDEPLMLDLTQGIFGAADPEFLRDAEDPHARAMGSILSFISYFDGLTKERQACPAEDLASVIANGRIDGCPMADDRRLWYYILVATAGHDTTSFALSGGMKALLDDVDQLWALRDDPDLVANAAAECIRWTSPVRHFLRYATEDTVVGGIEIPAGDCVLLSYPSANRDEDVFTDPMTFDVHRRDADRLISFGVGAHFCLGAQFARRELRTMLGKLSRELTHIEQAGEATYAESNFVSGVKHLPVAYAFR